MPLLNGDEEPEMEYTIAPTDDLETRALKVNVLPFSKVTINYNQNAPDQVGDNGDRITGDNNRHSSDNKKVSLIAKLKGLF